MISPRNRLLFWFALVALPFSVLAGVHPATLGICVVLIAALVVFAVLDGVLSRGVLDGIELDLPPVSRMGVKKDGQIELRLKNPTRCSRKLRLAWPLPGEFFASCEELDVALPEGAEWSQLPWPCRPEKRGNYPLPTVHLEASSRLGFWNIRRSLSLRGEIRVYPDLQKEKKGLDLMFRGAFGTHAQRQIGKGREFEKLREYVAGDGSEDIHWKATARRGQPITKVFQIERTQEVYVAMDVSRLSAREDAIERHLSSALLLGLAAEQQGDLFGLLSFSDRVENFVRARNGYSHYQSCRDAIYALQPRVVNPDFDEVCTFIRLRLRRRSLLIFLTVLDDPVLAGSFLRNVELVARQHLVVVGMMRPPGIFPMFSDPVFQTGDLYERLGSHLRWQSLEELGGQLRRRGVKWTLFDSERMGLRLVSEYLNIKKRQIL